jgi:dipeptidyl aminopeptidase/acylaminoacyl peptidase
MRRMKTIPFFLSILFLSACTTGPQPTLAPSVPRIVYIQYGETGIPQLLSQPDLESQPVPIPYTFPVDCLVYKLTPNPAAALLAIEFACGDESLLQVPDLDAGDIPLKPAYQETARFMAWSADGGSLYVKKNIFQEPEIDQVNVPSFHAAQLPVPGNAYDLTALPDGKILYSTTSGIGFGSETWLAGAAGGNPERVLNEPGSIVAYLRPSPDGSRVAFIVMVDSQVPFTVGELWLMDFDGGNARMLGQADAGHGYAPAWSPDGSQIAIVVRENPDDPDADQSAGALLSNLYLVDILGGEPAAVTTFSDAIVESPVWSPDGTALIFNVVRDDKISLWLSEAGKVRQFAGESACCAVWVPGN